MHVNDSFQFTIEIPTTKKAVINDNSVNNYIPTCSTMIYNKLVDYQVDAKERALTVNTSRVEQYYMEERVLDQCYMK